MKKVLVSSGTFEHERLLEFSEPTFKKYAKVHDYNLLIDRGIPPKQRNKPYDYRHARWRKIELIKEALHSHDVVLWMDSDVMVTRYDKDILDDLPENCFQGMVMEYRRNYFFPNTGVWLLRNREETHLFIDVVMQTGLFDHTYADQPAVWNTLGWSLGGPKGKGAKPVGHSPFLANTGWLPFEWNPVGLTSQSVGRVCHFMGLSVDESCKRMAKLAKVLENPGKKSRIADYKSLLISMEESSSAPA